MNGAGIEWLVVILFFLVFWGSTAGEAAWLSKRGWATFARSLAFAISSNLTGLFIGSFVVFVILGILLMFTFEPVEDRRANELIMWIGVILALIFPPLFLVLVKRLFLKLFKMDAGRKVWGFAVLSSILIVFGSVLVPWAAIYLQSKMSR